ncbi:MAG: Asp-tRNA(Asn)/Glu-tRNA(Gln) amidotransferase subunit GatB, partial [Chloroflexota bacterium]
MTEAGGALERYEAVIGIEVHSQLRTESKMFCACSTAYDGARPNTHVCPVCLGLPGALPTINRRAVEHVLATGAAIEATAPAATRWDRKNYFYPDLPKGYQISQFDKPLALDGMLVIGEHADGSLMRVRITRVHMEEDAGKSIHDRYPGASAIDLNRAGTPLIEIVSEPDIRSAAEAGSYLRLLRQVLEYVDVSDLNMEEGSLRVDANISIRERGAAKLGTKTEVKNMNSFSGVERALDAEFVRQVAIVESHGRVEQETLLWDADRG